MRCGLRPAPLSLSRHAAWGLGLATCAPKKDLRPQVFFWRSQEKNPEPKLRVASRLGRLVERPRFAIMFPPFIRGLYKNTVLSDLCGVHVTKIAV